MAHFVRALGIVGRKMPDGIEVVVFGSNPDCAIADRIGYPVRFVGRLRDEWSLALLYNAGDVLVAPSLAESLGQVVLESLACGTPAVAFGVGGLLDLVVHRQNGYLAHVGDEEDLAAGICWTLANDCVSKGRDALVSRCGYRSVVAQHESIA